MTTPVINYDMHKELVALIRINFTTADEKDVQRIKELAVTFLDSAYQAAQKSQTSIKTIECSKIDSRIINIFLKKNFEIDNLSWSPDNKHLNPKPIFYGAAKGITAHFSYFQKLRETGKHSDAQIKYGEQIVNVHKAIITRSPYFETFFQSGLKESNNLLEIRDENISFDAFSKVLDYLYTEEFPPAEQALETLVLADYLVLYDLFNIAKAQIYEQIQVVNFLAVALAQMRFKDIDLKALCEWFIRSHPKIEEEVNLAELSCLDLIKTCHVGALFHTGLEKAAKNLLKNKLKLDDDFIEVCKYVKAQKNLELHNILNNVVLKNKGLCSQLKEEAYAAQCQVWKEFSTSLDWENEKKATEVKV